MARGNFSWILGAGAFAIAMTAAVAVFVIFDAFLFRLLSATFAVVLVLAIIFHPDFILRRMGATLISASLWPHGVELAVRTLLEGGDSAPVDWAAKLVLSIDGTPGWLLLGAGVLLMVVDAGLKTLRDQSWWPLVRVEPIKDVGAVDWSAEHKGYDLSGNIELRKTAGKPLLVNGATALSPVPWSSVSLPSHEFSVTSPIVLGAFDEPGPGAPVDLSKLAAATCKFRVIVKNRRAAWAHGTGSWSWLRCALRHTLFRRVTAKLSIDIGGLEPRLLVLVLGSPKRATT